MTDYWPSIQFDQGKQFPSLYRMALDYLPIQSSAVPCERIFSSAAETDTKRCNRTHPALMEALQILKFSLKRERLDFTDTLVTSEEDMLLLSGDDDCAVQLTTVNSNVLIQDFE